VYLRVPPCQALRSRKITPPALRPITVESFLSTQSRAICQRRSRNPEPAGCLGTYEYSGPWYHVVLLCCCLLFFFVFVLTSSRALRGGPAVSRGSCACLGSGGSLRAHARERLSDGRRETGRQGDRETERQRDRKTHRGSRLCNCESSAGCGCAALLTPDIVCKVNHREVQRHSERLQCNHKQSLTKRPDITTSGRLRVNSPGGPRPGPCRPDRESHRRRHRGADSGTRMCRAARSHRRRPSTSRSWSRRWT